MQKTSDNNFSLWKIILPVGIGLIVITWMIASEANGIEWEQFRPTLKALLMILLAFCFMACRDLGYIFRIRLLSRNFLSFKQSFRVIMLWEFTSAVTPSSVGGSAVATVFVCKEGLPVGRSAAMVILTAMMDELFFVLLFPLIILIIGYDRVFSINPYIVSIVIAGYFAKLLLALALAYGLFINPHSLKKIIIAIFSLPILKRWRDGAEKTGDDIILSSNEIKNYNTAFWFKAAGATCLSWCSRFLVANAIFCAFFTLKDQILVFVRQMAMWIPMIIAPTPGGSGFAEYIFSGFLSDVTDSAVSSPANTAFIALLWRFVTYYPYLIIGTLIIPHWLSTKFSNNR